MKLQGHSLDGTFRTLSAFYVSIDLDIETMAPNGGNSIVKGNLMDI